MPPLVLPATVAVCLVLLASATPLRAHGLHDASTAFALDPSAPAARAANTASTQTPRIAGEILVIEDDGTMVEEGRFVASRIMPAFYSAMPDSFEFVSLFGASTFAEEMNGSAAQYLVRRVAAGLGKTTDYDRNGPLGIHTRRLQSIQLMRDVRYYGATPGAPVPSLIGDFTGVELLASEVVHAYGIWLDLPHLDLGGRSDHWGWFVNTDASVMAGCRWRDEGDGSFTSEAMLDGLSELEEYLFGLRAAEDVGPMFVIVDPKPRLPPGRLPIPGSTVRGTRIDFGIEDFVAEHGRRVPDASSAPHRFRMAFALVVPQGTEAPASDLTFLESFRTEWEEWFREETEGLGSMDTTLPRVPPTAAFDVDRIAGALPVTVRFEDRSTGTIEGRLWDFGDGSPRSSATNPLHVYDAAGVYDVTLTVSGPGAPDTVTREDLVTVADFQHVVFDDFELTSGWTVVAGDALRGSWEQGDPEGTVLFGVHAQPELPASGASCWMTGLAAGDFAAAGDVDGGSTTLHSPVLRLATVEDPHVSYARWWSNNLAAADDDTLRVDVSSDAGATWWPLESAWRSGTEWQWVQFRIADHVTPTDGTCFRFVASDLGQSSLVEAGVDAFVILGRGRSTSAEPLASPARPQALAVSPNPFRSAASIRWTAPRVGSVHIAVYDLGGRLVRVLENGERPAAGQTAWDGRDAHGRPVASGVYTVRFETADGTAMRKVVRLR